MRPALTFDPGPHRYTVNGRPVPSVTQVIGGMYDLAGIPQPVLDFARDRGSAVHAAIDLDVAGTLDEASVDERVRPYLQGFRDFRRDTGATFIGAELRVGSVRYGFAGTLDLLGTLRSRPNRTALIDTKATHAIPRTVGIQTMAYALGAAETLELDPDRVDRYCLHLKKDGRYRLVEQTSVRDRSLFIAALNIRRFMDGHD